MARDVGGEPEGHGIVRTEERKRLPRGVVTRVSGSQENQRREGHDLERRWPGVGHDSSGFSDRRFRLSPPQSLSWNM